MAKDYRFFSLGEVRPAGRRALVYGAGGIGKTTLAAHAPGPVGVIDLDGSLGVLAGKLKGLDVRCLQDIPTWPELIDGMLSKPLSECKTVVLDTGTKAEELAIAHTLATIPHEKGHKVERIEDYGWGKGYSYVYDTFISILAVLDSHIRQGRNVVVVCHDCTSNVPNPAGDDWLRYEPRLQTQTSGKASIRLRMREWADHVLFVGYDVDVKDGKGRGAGTRTVYPSELPFCMAKSRTLMEPVPLPVGFDADTSGFWLSLFGASAAVEQKPPRAPRARAPKPPVAGEPATA